MLWGLSRSLRTAGPKEKARNVLVAQSENETSEKVGKSWSNFRYTLYYSGFMRYDYHIGK